jgi:predicted nuclease of predicted toxin-antitoxin system
MRFLIGNQLPAGLAAHLRGHGHDGAHVSEIGMDEADDAAVWDRGSRDGAVVISKDEDFIFLANRPGDQGRLV